MFSPVPAVAVEYIPRVFCFLVQNTLRELWQGAAWLWFPRVSRTYVTLDAFARLSSRGRERA